MIQLNASRLLRLAKKPRSFQDKRGRSDERWALFAPHLPRSGSVLDVGCDEGEFTERCANAGLFALGVERSDVLHLATKHRLGNRSMLGFMQADTDMRFFESIPRFDCILFLSVHHHYWRIHGRAYAEEVLRLAAEKCDLMIYEAPIRTSRYRPRDTDREIPDFVDLDPDSAARWYENWIKATVPGVEVRRLGFSPCVGEREPVRPVFRIDCCPCPNSG